MLNKEPLLLKRFLPEKKKGFTFIELIITIFVLLIGVLAAFIAAQQPMRYTAFSISRLTATYLAQEGIEIVRNIRDENWLNGNGWANGLNGCSEVDPGGGCQADYNDGRSFTSYDGSFLNIENDSGLYGYGAGSPTKFKRKITINPTGSDNAQVIVSVEWEEKGKGFKVEARENLYNWAPGF